MPTRGTPAPAVLISRINWVTGHMAPAGRAFHECRMQFPRPCIAPRIRIVGIATFVDTVEHSPNRIACATAPSERQQRARGPDTSHVGPTPRAWVRWYARGRRPRAYLGVCVRVTGLTRIVGGSCASDAPGQAPLRPSRRAPCPRHPVVGVCYRGGLRLGRYTVPRRDLTASMRGDLRCTGTRA